MGRRPAISREGVLDAAERVIVEGGGNALTIDAVAKAAGVSKGGIQSCFSTKELLVSAMLDRWTVDYERQVAGLLCGDPSPIARVSAHVRFTETDPADAQTRAASLLAALLQHPEHLEGARRWYAGRLGGLGTTVADRDARLAFFATEGAFLLRFLGLMPIEDDAWAELFATIRARLLPNGRDAPAS